MNPAVADLELTITTTELRMRLERPGNKTSPRGGPFSVAIAQAALQAYGTDPVAYGAALYHSLFTPEAAAKFREMRAAAVGNDETIRVRLDLPPDLHRLRWETLLVPGTEQAMAVDSRLLLSRYVSTDDYAPIRLRPKGKLRALIAVAAPGNYATYNLAPIDAVAEAAPIQEALAALNPTTITATWNALSSALRDGYDILYLVAHGTIQDGQPWLYLVNDQGNVDYRRAKVLIDLLRALGTRRPRLVVLTSCAGAGNGYGDTLAALGPQIAQADVPAVLAMQGDISLPTIRAFMPVFCRELLHDGLIDRAVNSARLAVRERSDWWMPVLYIRLRDGRIWHDSTTPTAGVSALPLSEPQPGFVGREDERGELKKLLLGNQTQKIGVIIGMGGAGKTQLALQAAHAVAAHYPDHRIEINLMGSREQALSDVEALQAVIRALLPDVQLSDDRTKLIADYRSLLSGKRALILADDASDAAQVRALIPPAGSAMLITSRFRFLLDGMLPIDLEALPEIDAVGLLQQLCPQLNADEAKQIAAACGRLPLALRIAGGVLTQNETMQAARYLRRLKDIKRTLPALIAPNDTDLNMEASIALSYTSLKRRLQTMLCRLGVFRESFDLAAATGVLKVSNEDEAHDVLSELYMRSLIEYDVHHERYRLHDLIRSFALRHIHAKAEEATRLRYARHYLTVAEQIDQLEAEGELPKARELFRTEFSSIDDAWQWSINRQTPETDKLAVDYGAALQVLVDRAYSLEAITARYTSLLPIAKRLKRHERIILFKLAHCASTIGDWAQVDRLMQQALELSRDHLEATVSLLSNKAVMAVDCLRYVEAAELAERALILSWELPDEQARQYYGPSAQLNLGLALYYIGDLEGAHTHFDALLAPDVIDIVDPQTRNSAYLNRGAVWLQQGQLDRAAADLHTAEQHIADQPQIVQAELYRLLAELALARGDLAAARTHCATAQEHLQSVFGSQSPAKARIHNEVAATCAQIAAGS